MLEDPSRWHKKDRVQGEEGYMEGGRQGFLLILEALDVNRSRHSRDVDESCRVRFSDELPRHLQGV